MVFALFIKYGSKCESTLIEEIEIKTGIITPLYIEVITGLMADQEVIIGDWEKLIKEAKESKNKGSALKKILWMVRSK